MEAVTAAESGEASATDGGREEGNADLARSRGSQARESARTSSTQLSPPQVPSSSELAEATGPSSSAHDSEVSHCVVPSRPLALTSVHLASCTM